MDTNTVSTFSIIVDGIINTFAIIGINFGIQYLIGIFFLIALRVFAYRKWLWAKILFGVILTALIIFTFVLGVVVVFATALAKGSN